MHEHIARLKSDNVHMAALLKRATGEPLNAKEREVIEELAKAAALEGRLREKYDLGGAISKALEGRYGSTRKTIPPQVGDVGKALGNDNSLESAIAKAFGK